ncbi:MAG TPA: hypothetical protein VGQ22_13505 [Steroidobacteraceae bacterium]|jgi:hypothetical protein|nr:hypothetical protein [Steroidobacteraceae bacterium]
MRMIGRLVCLTGLALSAAPLSAQTHADSIKVRNDCRLAVQVLTKGVPGPQRTDALNTIGLCGSEGVPALVAVWSAAADDRAELGPLVTGTRAFVTPELVSTLFSTLEQPGRSLNARVAALLVLLTYADSSVVPGFENFVGDPAELLVHHYGAIDHPAPVVGRERLPEPVTERLRSTLQAIAAGDADPRMQVAARVALNNPPLAP